MLLKHLPHPRADWEEIVTLNGQVSPDIDIRPGEAQFWRIANIGADLFLNVKLDGASMYAIATDGHPLLRPKRIDGALLGPGQRLEVVVIGPPAGRYAFRSTGWSSRKGDRRYRNTRSAFSCQRERRTTRPPASGGSWPRARRRRPRSMRGRGARSPRWVVVALIWWNVSSHGGSRRDTKRLTGVEEGHHPLRGFPLTSTDARDRASQPKPRHGRSAGTRHAP